jgi:hypothetical protein
MSGWGHHTAGWRCIELREGHSLCLIPFYKCDTYMITMTSQTSEDTYYTFFLLISFLETKKKLGNMTCIRR